MVWLMIVATPAAAFDAMTVKMCQESIEKVGDYLPARQELATRMASSVVATSMGWCRVERGDPGFEAAEFASFEWRSDDTARWTAEGIPPLAMQLRFAGLNADVMQRTGPTDRPPLSVTATLRQDPNAGQVILERAEMFNDAGDVMAISGVMDRVFLSAPSMMQVSIGSATFRAGLFTMTLSGVYENPFGFELDISLRGDPDARRRAAFDWISKLPDGVVDDASRAELMAYAGDLPAPVGTMEVSAASERGLGLMQLLASVADEDRLEIMLDGVTARADWTPAAQVAD